MTLKKWEWAFPGGTRIQTVDKSCTLVHSHDQTKIHTYIPVCVIYCKHTIKTSFKNHQHQKKPSRRTKNTPVLDTWRSRRHCAAAARRARGTQSGTPEWSLPSAPMPTPTGNADTGTCWNHIQLLSVKVDAESERACVCVCVCICVYVCVGVNVWVGGVFVKFVLLMKLLRCYLHFLATC